MIKSKQMKNDPLIDSDQYTKNMPGDEVTGK
jgi:hypothetical protein